jgi:hypothetical protein
MPVPTESHEREGGNPGVSATSNGDFYHHSPPRLPSLNSRIYHCTFPSWDLWVSLYRPRSTDDSDRQTTP